MARSFADTVHFNGRILNSYLIAVQTGNDTAADGGLEQMKYVLVGELKPAILNGLGEALHFRGAYSTELPVDLAQNDYFYTNATFTADGQTFVRFRFYAYNGEDWSDISNVILEQYSPDEVIASLVSRVTTNEQNIGLLEQRITVLANGVVLKGDVANVASLPASPSAGDMYWVIDQDTFYAYSESAGAWIPLTDSRITLDRLDSHSTTNPLSANKGRELAERLGAFNFNQEELNADVVFEGDSQKSWEHLFNNVANEPRHNFVVGDSWLSTWQHIFAATEEELDNDVVFEGDHKKTWEGLFNDIPREGTDGIFLSKVSSAPASASSTGTEGQYFVDSSYLYLCIATNTWVRVAVSTWS